jgi:UDP-N-acetylglucosamine--N-acetylmuramyl-(pentapeptide) pyrophosphoryl-undecaprenol N-acetylglucosamine transferase
MNEALRVVIAGGGTGGHLYPGIAVARELLRRHPAARISFAGTARGIEARVLPREGFPLDLLHSSGFKGKSLIDRLRGAALLPVSLVDAFRIVGRRRPHLVVGVGGYSSGPVVLAAAARGVPTMLLEQNAVPGLTNRMLGPFVRAAAVTFETTQAFFGSKAFLSGNPVRAEFFEALQRRESNANEEAPGSLVGAVVRVLVFGGSQGAHAINVAMVEAAPELAAYANARFGEPGRSSDGADERRPARASGLRLTHQTGDRDVEMVRVAYRRAGLQADVEPFLFDMGRRIADADLIVCRAGATTLAEITAANKAAILVPLPTATDDHQRKNAEALEEAGAADVLLQAEMTGPVLARRILALAADGSRRAGLARAAAALARPDAARIVVDRALELVT